MEDKLIQLRALLELLEEFGVEAYEDDRMKLVVRAPDPNLGSAQTSTVTEVKQAPSAVKKARTLWDDPALWPGGEPPTFPKDR